jgi:hypothetical protein
MKSEKIKAKYGFAFDPAVSLIILDIKVKLNSASSCTLVGIIDFFLVPIKNKIKIVNELITINKLAFVNEISRFPNFISGPIL